MKKNRFYENYGMGNFKFSILYAILWRCQIAVNFPQIGVNLVMFDGEDMGIPGENETYCQGSRYFAKYPPIPLPYEAINLDMVGDKQLHLPIEKYSLEFNPELVRYLWKRADDLGLDAFDMTPQYAIYDDHVPLYQIAGIPAIDLIDFKYPNPYANFWHTMDDTPENCSAESLGQVGRLMVDYIYYRENQNSVSYTHLTLPTKA